MGPMPDLASAPVAAAPVLGAAAAPMKAPAPKSANAVNNAAAGGNTSDSGTLLFIQQVVQPQPHMLSYSTCRARMCGTYSNLLGF